jgi:actin-like ATPase involved in cell morphogenesis
MEPPRLDSSAPLGDSPVGCLPGLALDFLGIDFGTTNSSMARFAADTGRAVVVCNAEGGEKTPSIVYFGETETLAGDAAAHVLADSGGDPETAARVIRSVKRSLVSPPRIAVPGGRTVRPTDVAAQILAKLRRDADQRNGGNETKRAVITCPAVFDAKQQQAIVDAAQLSGFSEVELVEEPVAAALAFQNAGGTIGKGVLVYDFGGGTFDAAFVVREEGEDRYYLALEPDGDRNCGGDDIDQALYDFFDREAREQLGRPISGGDDLIDPAFLNTCRRRKETLSKSRQATFSVLLSGGQTFRSSIDRETFEGLVEPIIERTIRITEQVAKRASDAGYPVDTVLLVGGSSQVPMVERRITEALAMKPQTWGHRDLAVALGAAYHAVGVWGSPAARAKPRSAADDYRQAVELVWSDGRLEPEEATRLTTLAAELELAPEDAAQLEREVIGKTKEELLRRAEPAREKGATPPPEPPPKPKQRRSRKPLAIGAAVVALLAAGGAAAAILPTDEEVDPPGNTGVDRPARADTAGTPETPTEEPPATSDVPAGLSESGTVEKIETILWESFDGRIASVEGRYDAALRNRNGVLADIEALMLETDHLHPQLELFRAAIESSIAAIRAYQACGDASCAPLESETATADKQTFVESYNPIAEQHGFVTWKADEF